MDQRDLYRIKFLKDLKTIDVPDTGRGLRNNGRPPTVEGLENMFGAVLRRIVTNKRTLVHRPDFGCDLRQSIERSMTPTHQALVANAIKAAIKQDPRVVEAGCRTYVQGDVMYAEVSVILSGETDPQTFKILVPDEAL